MNDKLPHPALRPLLDRTRDPLPAMQRAYRGAIGSAEHEIRPMDDDWIPHTKKSGILFGQWIEESGPYPCWVAEGEPYPGAHLPETYWELEAALILVAKRLAALKRVLLEEAAPAVCWEAFPMTVDVSVDGQRLKVCEAYYVEGR